jgi:hypothetical protein
MLRLIALVTLLALIAFHPRLVALASERGTRVETYHIRTSVGSPGYWRLVQTATGEWWFLSPEGDKEFVTAVTTVQPVQHARKGRGYVSKDFQGDVGVWAGKTSQRVREAGFKAVGAWSHPSLRSLPYSRDLNLWVSTKTPIDSVDWEGEVERHVIEQVVALKTDRNLIGYYFDNEIKWHDPEVAKHAKRYFEVASRLVRKHDPNHLILGVRFNRRPPLDVLRASVGHVDAHSVNCYNDGGFLWRNMFKEMYQIVQRPIVISEFSVYSNDNRTGNTNSYAWWAGVASQHERGEAYKRFVVGAAETGFIVGCDYFQWADEPAGGRVRDGEDINTGVVDVFDEPYKPMVAASRWVGREVNAVHSRSNANQSGIIWHDDPDRLAQ